MNTLAGFEGMNWLMIIIVGGIAGFIAEKLTKSDMGLIMNIVVGIIGGILGNLIAGTLGFVYTGFWGALLWAVVGAIVIILILRAVRGRSAA